MALSILRKSNDAVPFNGHCGSSLIQVSDGCRPGPLVVLDAQCFRDGTDINLNCRIVQNGAEGAQTFLAPLGIDASTRNVFSCGSHHAYSARQDWL